MKEKMTEIGVIIGRFQVHNLHHEHLKLIETVFDNHDKVIIFLGTTTAINTKKNPLDFITRKLMVEKECAAIILPLPDCKSDLIWSKNIDIRISEVFPNKEATLYGSRDSFIPYYKGKHKTCELEPESYISATGIRDKISKKILSSADFRAGIIYSVYSQYPIMFSTVDVVIVKNDQILLGRKKDETRWRFVGGFVDPTDETEELACAREAREETGLELSDFKFICSKKISDWRYKGIQDRAIMTHFYEAKYIFGSPQPMDDIEELKWFNFSEQLVTELVEDHQKLFNEYVKWKKFSVI